ncbi:glycosyltransferase, partial [archaeon]
MSTALSVLNVVPSSGDTHMVPAIQQAMDSGCVEYDEPAHQLQCRTRLRVQPLHSQAGDEVEQPAAAAHSLTFAQLPAWAQASVQPLHGAYIGSLKRPYDGTKHFFVQYESVPDRRLLAMSHLDLISNPRLEADNPILQQQRAAGVSVTFLRMRIAFSAFPGGLPEFSRAALRLARLPSICDVAPRLQSVLARTLDFFATQQLVWMQNHNPDDEYLLHAARLMDPTMVRVNDVVGRLDLACRFRRPAHHRTAQWPVAWGHVGNVCNAPDETSAENELASAMETPLPLAANDSAPRYAFEDNQYTIAHCASDWDAFMQPFNALGHTVKQDPVHFTAAQQAWHARDAHESSARMDRAVPSSTTQRSRPFTRGVSTMWERAPYDVQVAPSHFAAMHAAVQQAHLRTIVLHGLTLHEQALQPVSRIVTPQQYQICANLWRRSPTSTDRAPLTLAFIGRLAREKGLPLFLQAVSQLLHQEPDSQVHSNQSTARPLNIVVLGAASSPLYLQAMRVMAEELGVAGEVHFQGFVAPTQLRRWYEWRCIDVVAAPYVRPNSETFGLVLMEAMLA